MPTVPDFNGSTNAKIAWLRKNFKNSDEFYNAVNGRSTTIKRIDTAVFGAGCVATALTTTLSAILKGLAEKKHQYSVPIVSSNTSVRSSC